MPAYKPDCSISIVKLLLAISCLVLTGACTPTKQIAQVLVISAGTTISKTPPSSVFPPIQPGQQPLSVPGSTGAQSNPAFGSAQPYQTIELRGWLTLASQTCNGADPDWHYGLAVDPAWLDSLGVKDFWQLIRPGNINEWTPQTGPPISSIGGTPVSWVIFGQPTIHVELNGWRQSLHGNTSPPADWGFSNADPGNCPGVLWADNPVNPLSFQAPLAVGQYVRMVGSLITDDPHESTAVFPTWVLANFGISVENDSTKQVEVALNVLQSDWAGGLADADPTNPARWTEMHPPDIIAVLDTPSQPHMPTETFRGVSLFSENCLIGPCAVRTLDVNISPPGTQPAGSTGINVVELVSPATNFSEIVSGNSSNSGALITIGSTSAHIHVAVQGQSGDGAPGKFAAFYRVSWKMPS